MKSISVALSMSLILLLTGYFAKIWLNAGKALTFTINSNPSISGIM